MFETLVWNTKTTNVRRETLEGRTHLVVPTVMMVEGVLHGSNGPLMYKKDDIRKRYQAWDNRPVVVYHPTKNGKAATAADPGVLNTQKVGVVLNTRYEHRQGKPLRLRAEAWIDEEKAKKLMPEVLEKIRKGEPVEVSTGLYTENISESGEFNGKKYESVATEFVPDHLAILPEGKGACSVNDGAGLNVNAAAGCCAKCGGKMSCAKCAKTSVPTTNAMSHSRVHDLIQKSLNDRYGDYQTRVADVYEGFVIYGKMSSNGGMKLYKHDYSTDKRRGEQDQISLKGDPTEVQRVTEYRTPDGVFVGNALYGVKTKGVLTVDKATLVTKVIANSNGDLDEDDREWLLERDDKWLKKRLHTKNTDPKEPAPTANAAVTPEPAKPQTLQELLNNAEPGIKELIQEGLASRQAEREKLIGAITANASNTFTKEQLAAMPSETLRGMAKLAGVKEEARNPLYAGAGGAIPPFVGNNGQTPAAAHTAPVLNNAPSTKPKSK